jgi:glucuronosyltransferase
MSSYSDMMTLYAMTIITIISTMFNAFVPRSYPEIWSNIKGKDLFHQPLPSNYEEMVKNISAVFINTHPSFSYPRTLPPQVIETGGIHCRPGKSLPKVLLTIL